MNKRLAYFTLPLVLLLAQAPAVAELVAYYPLS